VDVVPILRLFDPDLTAMVGTLQWQVVSYTPLLASLDLHFGVSVHDVNDATPYATLTCQELGISKHIETSLGSRQGHASTVVRREEADCVFSVATDKTQDDNVVFLT
jgi:hypothetical protein